MIRLGHFLFGCRGHVDRVIDENGVEWVGLRCVVCKRLCHQTLSVVQTTEAGRRAAREASR